MSAHCLLLVGLPSLVGAGLAAWAITFHVSHFWSHLLIGLMLAWSGLVLLRPSEDKKAAGRAETGPSSSGVTAARPGLSGVGTARKPDKEEEGTDAEPKLLMEVVIGLILGGLAALTGLMLGSLRLPLMLKYLKIDPKVAVGSNMAIGCLTAMAAATVYLWNARTSATDWSPLWLALAAVVPPTVFGGWLGVRLAGEIGKDDVRRLAG